MDYELFSSNFPLWLLNAGLNLAFTGILYGVGPLFFYQTKIFPTTKKRVMAFSIIYTILAWLSFNLIRTLWFSGDEIKIYPAVIWGTIFYNLLLRGLKKTRRLESSYSDDSSCVPDPLEHVPTEPAQENHPTKEQSTSFYESEKAAEHQSQKFGPLDPPQKFKRSPSSSARNSRILYAFCALSIIFGISSGIFFLYKANNVALRYEKGWNDGFNAGSSDLEKKYNELKHDYDFLAAEHRNLLVEHANLESEYDVMDEEYLYVIERSGFLMNSIGFIVNGSGYYHTYDCTEFQNADEFWAHNIEYCESMGYSKCPYCR